MVFLILHSPVNLISFWLQCDNEWTPWNINYFIYNNIHTFTWTPPEELEDLPRHTRILLVGLLQRQEAPISDIDVSDAIAHRCAEYPGKEDTFNAQSTHKLTRNRLRRWYTRLVLHETIKNKRKKGPHRIENRFYRSGEIENLPFRQLSRWQLHDK